MKSLIALLLLPLLASAAELPEPVLPAGVGVNIHFVRGHQHDLDLIAAGGFKFIRMDFGWDRIEKKRGEYNWSEYDELTRSLEARGLRAIYILDYSNPLYEGKVDSKNALHIDIKQRDTGSPQHPESIAAYANWAAASVKHFHGHHIVWEIWNEPNGFFWKPKPNAEQYSALAFAAAKIIRMADPEVTLIGPALSGFQPKFMDVFLKSGALEYLDAVSVHPYRRPTKWPETAQNDYADLRKKIELYAPAGKKNLPIISSEWGYSTCIGDVSPQTQAAYIVRQQLFNLLNHVTLSIWYDWRNDGANPREVEHNFGTVTDKLAPKPAYHAIKFMTRELAGFHIERRLDSDAADFILLLSSAAGEKKIVAWTTGQAHSVKIPQIKPGAEAIGKTGLGANFQVRTESGAWGIELEQMPKYVMVR